MSVEIRIKSVGKLQKTKKGDEYTGLQNETGDWINVMGDQTKLQKGQTLLLTDPKTLGTGTHLWAFVDKKKPDPPQPEPEKDAKAEGQPGEEQAAPPVPWVDPNRKTLEQYKAFVREVAALAAQVLPEDVNGNEDGQAVSAMVDTAVIAFLNGKIIMEDEPEPEPGQDDVPF